jgi:hypothetical protein
MAEPGTPSGNAPEIASPAGPARTKDEVALELMRFIAVATGFGRASQTGAGFSGKPGVRSPEEQAEALLSLFERCRQVVNK